MAARSTPRRRRSPGTIPVTLGGTAATNPFATWTDKKYGIELNAPAADYQWEMAMFMERWPSELSRYDHMRAGIEMMWPDNVWTPWRETRFRELCDPVNTVRYGQKRVTAMQWVGCGAGAKTYDSAILAAWWWLCAPEISRVVLTTTTKGALRQRIWPMIQSLFNEFDRRHLATTGMIGPHMIQSQTILEAVKGDELHAIYGQAVKDGETEKAVANLLGRHSERMMLIVDEAVATPLAIYETIPNIIKGATEVVLLFINNAPQTRHDPFSKLCEPVLGWSAVGPESTKWDSRGSPDWQVPRGVCLHFSAAFSPNVAAGRTIFPFLYHYEDWVRVQAIPDIQRKVSFWIQDLGFWPPTDILTTVLTNELIERVGARGQFTFQSWRKPIAGLDPAFGGDDCVFTWGWIGDLPNGKLGIQVSGWRVIPILLDSKDDDGRPLPAEYQIARAVRADCEALGVKPDMLGIESTGTGRGVASVLAVEWGPVNRIESGGSPTDSPVASDDMRPAREVYDRRITELCFQVAAVVESGQLRGLPEEAAYELTTRVYELSGKKYSVETKEELKKRLGRSPDHADSLAMLVEVARLQGVSSSPELATLADIYDADTATDDDPNDHDSDYADSRAHDAFEMFRDAD